MKVYGLPEELEATLPKVDYANFDHDKMAADEDAHKADIKSWLIANGYDGEHTGREFRTPQADGYARYMFGDRKGSPILLHLPYGDGWNSRDVEFLPKREVVKRMDQQDAMVSMFARKAG